MNDQEILAFVAKYRSWGISVPVRIIEQLMTERDEARKERDAANAEANRRCMLANTQDADWHLEPDEEKV